MEAIISSFRRGRHHQSANQMILSVTGIDNKEAAAKLVDKEVSWLSPAKKEIKGKISAVHGNKGAVRAIFETGMPGQALGTKVTVK